MGDHKILLSAYHLHLHQRYYYPSHLAIPQVTIMRILVIRAAGCLFLTAITGKSMADEPPIRSTENLVFNCFTCHGTEGKSVGTMPSLNGKTATYLFQKLTAYQHDEASPTIMNRIAKGYSQEEIQRIAHYLGVSK
jgi:cytochrome subunit of sulfide dehydrogenase